MKICLCKDSTDGDKTVGVGGGLWIHDKTTLNRGREILLMEKDREDGVVSLSGTITKHFHENPGCIDLLVMVSKLYDEFNLDKTAFVAGARAWYRQHISANPVLSQEAFKILYDPSQL